MAYNENKISLLDSPVRVATPFVKVTIGDYTFGVFREEGKTVVNRGSDGVYKIYGFQYPNYIKSLKVTKINGKVNTYTLNISYPITENSDPNFFEKVFSSVSKSRKIVFSYGDLSAPKFLYKEENALITRVYNSFDINGAVINYTVHATSTGALAASGAYNFVSSEYVGPHQPSAIIKKILRNNTQFGLLDVFSGMRNTALVESLGLIQSDDKIVNLTAKTNINVLDYIKYLVSCMRRQSDKSIYTMVVVDDTSDVLNGPYFKIVNAAHSGGSLDTYEITIGYPSNVIVQSFSIDNNESFSILYNYNKELNTNEYVTRIDDAGTEGRIYSPNITSNNDEQITRSNDLNWWKNVTQYPIKATITIKGLLRPAILMSKAYLNVLFYGKAHISSGEYIINQQEDNIDSSGCWTTLNLVRIEGDTKNFKEVL